MYALVESAGAINLFKNDNLVASHNFKDSDHAQRIYEDMENILIDNDDLMVDKSLVKAGQKGRCKSMKLTEDKKKIKLKEKKGSVRRLSHSVAHKNVKFYTLDPLIAQSYYMLKQIENDIERYGKRAAGIYFSYLLELKIRKRRDESGDEKVEYKDSYDIEVISKPWKIKENENMNKKYYWTKDSAGIVLSSNDWENLQKLVDLVGLKKENMNELLKYLEQRVETHAPNLNALLGFRLAAELITLCGSLINHARCSSSTVQVLRAEKALFRSLKNKTPTPKYGIIKGNNLTKSPRVIRSLANKIVICARIDVFRRAKTDAYGKVLRDAVEMKIGTGKKILIDGVLARVSGQVEAAGRKQRKKNKNRSEEEEKFQNMEREETAADARKRRRTSRGYESKRKTFSESVDAGLKSKKIKEPSISGDNQEFDVNSAALSVKTKSGTSSSRLCAVRFR